MCNLLKIFTLLGLLLAATGVWAAGQSVTINKVVAVVNGEMITLHDLQKAAAQEVARRGFTGSDTHSASGRETVYREVLDSMVMDALLRQEAARMQITVSDSEVDNELRKFIQQSQLNPQDFEDQLIMQGSNMPQLKKHIYENILRQRMITVMIARKVVVTKEEIIRYYEEHKAQFSNHGEVDLSMIVFLPEDPEVENIHERLKSGELNFEDAAQQYSIAPSAAQGGGIGSVPWKDLHPAWKDALGELKAGEISTLLPYGTGQAVLRLNSTIEGSQQSLEEVSPRIEELLREGKLGERFDEYAKQLRSKAVVDIRL